MGRRGFRNNRNENVRADHVCETKEWKDKVRRWVENITLKTRSLGCVDMIHSEDG